MPVFLDNEHLDIDDLGHDASIGQALEVAKTCVQGTGRLILGLRVSEQEVEADQIADLLTAPITDFDRLDFLSGRPQEMVLEALQASRRAFEDTFAVVKEAADSLSKGGLARTMSLLADCFNIWGQTHESVCTAARLLQLDLDNLQLAGRPVAEWLNQLSEKLRDIRSAIESRDHVLLGDILKYEVDELLAEWERTLTGLIEHVELEFAA